MSCSPTGRTAPCCMTSPRRSPLAGAVIRELRRSHLRRDARSDPVRRARWAGRRPRSRHWRAGGAEVRFAAGQRQPLRDHNGTTLLELAYGNYTAGDSTAAASSATSYPSMATFSATRPTVRPCSWPPTPPSVESSSTRWRSPRPHPGCRRRTPTVTRTGSESPLPRRRALRTIVTEHARVWTGCAPGLPGLRRAGDRRAHVRVAAVRGWRSTRRPEG